MRYDGFQDEKHQEAHKTRRCGHIPARDFDRKPAIRRGAAFLGKGRSLPCDRAGPAMQNAMFRGPAKSRYN